MISSVRFFLFVFLALATRLGAAPNIVFIMADDLGWDDVGYHGSEIRTPSIDKLAESGVELDRYYAFPVCSPTRAALMTARSPFSMGIDGPMGDEGGIAPGVRTMADHLRASGYQTWIAGKWHLGHSHVKYFPHNRGFDKFYGHVGGTLDYYTHIFVGGLDWQRNGVSVEEEGYSTHLLTAEAEGLIRGRDKQRPFFLYLAYNAPHTPLMAPKEALAKVSHIEDERRRIYAAMVEELDAGIGKVMAAIRSEGLLEDTIVVWVSDNGGNLQAGASNTPLRAGKGAVFEGGIRVPGLVSWPGTLGAGGKMGQMVTAHDWMPTLFTAAGLELPEDKRRYGHDMWPAIAGGKTIDRRATVIGSRGSFAIFRSEWKYLRNANERFGEPTGLYRIFDDPSEQYNLEKTHPDLVAELGGLIDALPKAPSLALPPPNAGGAAAEEGRANKKGGKKGGKKTAGGRGPRDPLLGWPEPTRPPLAESAKRD